MAKWAKDKHAQQDLSSVATQSEEELPGAEDSHKNGEPGNQNDARMAILNQIADSADDVRKDSLTGVDTEDYEDGPGTGEEPEEEQHEEEAKEEEKKEEVKEEKKEEPRKFKLKINGVEQELTEEEVLIRAQKVSAADQYLAEASKLYAEASKTLARPSQDDVAKAEEDDLALARALQMGTEEDALKAIRALKGSQRLSTDDVAKLIDTRFEQRIAFNRDLNRFTTDYKDLLADDNVKALVFELDEAYHAKGEAPGYDRFKKAAEAVKKSLGTRAPSASMTEKEQKKASVKVPQGNAARQPAQQEEKEPTTSEVIGSMAKARGQFIAAGG